MTSQAADKTSIETRYREYCDACQSGQLQRLTEFWSLPAQFTVDFGGPDTVRKIVKDPAELEKLYSTEFGPSTGVDKTTIDTSEVTFFGERLATIETTLRHTVKGTLHDRQHATHPELYHGGYVAQFVEKHVSIPVSIPKKQVDALEEKAKRNEVTGFSQDDMPKANSKTPALPPAWRETTSAEMNYKFPDEAIVGSKSEELRPGKLYLDERMTLFLSTAEPEAVRGRPLCFFNLFKYAKGDRAVHDSYMNGFKDRFGPDAGAEINFTGPVKDKLSMTGDREDVGEGGWDDANLVQ
ncbi:hypothetical protein M409DRAFT_23272 [Zasmidium cellare ATCC 36951]|uniref:Uncharacterized protein n=1 Tax=Zasmidium cellare ATCC 36951 TaxID=1080233 RepID=A0A6A6CKF7_ZASCE|nr:uncharacterized protein M409DRAFT_23272 [Zasmidium cellare ATCC 36951]KAF2166640.1 hypothetical protein M409DRAFT_23272 [Zasmidium cellare ATCC 36951]